MRSQSRVFDKPVAQFNNIPDFFIYFRSLRLDDLPFPNLTIEIYLIIVAEYRRMF